LLDALGEQLFLIAFDNKVHKVSYFFCLIQRKLVDGMSGSFNNGLFSHGSTIFFKIKQNAQFWAFELIDFLPGLGPFPL
jgi:hypothetical protein